MIEEKIKNLEPIEKIDLFLLETYITSKVKKNIKNYFKFKKILNSLINKTHES